MNINPYPTAFPYGNGMVLHFYHQQESSTTKTVHKVINKGLHDVAGRRPATSWSVHYTTSCNTQSSAPEDG